jgi:hypothetical protein
MNWFKKLFGLDLSNESSVPAAPISKSTIGTNTPQITLTCKGCNKTYAIGENSDVASLEFAMSLAKSSLVINDGNSQERVDLVVAWNTPPDDLAGARERALSCWKTIQDSLSQGQSRKWKCQSCNNINDYEFSKLNIKSTAQEPGPGHIALAKATIVHGCEWIAKFDDSTKAISVFSDAIEIYPSFLLAYLCRAMARLKLNDVTGYQEDLTKAESLEPGITKNFSTECSDISRFFIVIQNSPKLT